ncbi:hypothetical protein [Planctomicrobium sp. SH664]|uniref:hypothetical protein n=1 Tax=Planctomicrobium sp. SH664 TaxID=3448125 RepID=UPI003F5C3430
MVATESPISLLLLERLCIDMRAHLQSTLPPEPAVRPTTKAVTQRIADKGRLLISIAAAGLTALLEMTTYR